MITETERKSLISIYGKHYASIISKAINEGTDSSTSITENSSIPQKIKVLKYSRYEIQRIFLGRYEDEFLERFIFTLANEILERRKKLNLFKADFLKNVLQSA